MYILYIDTIYVYIYTHKHTYAHIPSRSMVFPSGIKEYMYVCICTDRYISKYINIYEIYIYWGVKLVIRKLLVNMRIKDY